MTAEPLDRRVRVARIIARMNVGGPAQQIARLVEGLDPERYDQRLFCGEVEEGEADYIDLRAPDLPHQRIGALRRSLGPQQDLAALAELVRQLRTFKPHIVHTHTAKAGVLGRLAAEVAGVPIRVHTFHGHLLNSYWSPRVTRAVVGVERALATRTDRILAVGRQVRDDLVAARVGRAPQYRVVPPGVAVGPVPDRGDARQVLDLPHESPVVVFAGRLVGVKRPDRMVEVARAVLAAWPEVTFVVAGEGPLYEATMAAAGDLGNRMRFLGWRGDIERVYAAADVVLLTSDNEGMPVGLIEAAMCGRACVTTDVGSAREVVLDGRTGHVTGTGVGELSDAVLDLVRDAPRRQSFAEAAKLHAEGAFGAARLIQDTDAIYREVLLEHRLLRVEATRS